MLTMSEFGRTSAENGARGTDHGEASLMIAAGGAVAGGVYNGDPDSWPGVYSVGRYVRGETYFTSVLAEISQNHFGLDEDTTAEVIPGHDAKGDGGHAFTGFIAT